MREKLIALIQKKIEVTKPECLAGAIADGLIEEGYLELSKIALLERVQELEVKLDSAECEAAVWNTRTNRQN